jgi:putative acetyltransferase
VVLAGHPAYYPRFGFVSAPAQGLQLRGFPDCEAFFVIELAPGALAGLTGECAFHPAFSGP